MADPMIIPSTWPLPEAIIARIGERVGRQRLMAHDEHILLVLHELPSSATPDRKGVLFWRAPDGKWATTASGDGLAELKAHVRSYDVAVDELDHRFENAQTATAFFAVLNEVAPISRAAKHLHQVLQQLREQVPDDRALITLRDQAYDVERAAELLRSEAQNALDYMVARRTEDQARRSEEISMATHRLNTLAAFFLPITAVASVLGANLPTGFESVKSPLLFWSIMVISLAVGLMMRGFLAKPQSAVRE